MTGCTELVSNGNADKRQHGDKGNSKTKHDSTHHSVHSAVCKYIKLVLIHLAQNQCSVHLIKYFNDQQRQK